MDPWTKRGARPPLPPPPTLRHCSDASMDTPLAKKDSRSHSVISSINHADFLQKDADIA